MSVFRGASQLNYSNHHGCSRVPSGDDCIHGGFIQRAASPAGPRSIDATIGLCCALPNEDRGRAFPRCAGISPLIRKRSGDKHQLPKRSCCSQ